MDTKALGWHSMSEMRRVASILKGLPADTLLDGLANCCKRLPDLHDRAEDPMFNAIMREMQRRRGEVEESE